MTSANATAAPSAGQNITRVRSGSAATSVRREFARHAVIHTAMNLGALACSGALAFVLPRFLNVSDYGYYRIFLLYGSFAGVLHLGFLDGLLLRWAARPVTRLRNELPGALTFLGIEQLIVVVPLVVGFALLLPRSDMLLILAIASYAVVWNWTALGQCVLQALKLFTHLSFFTILPPLILLLAAVALRRADHLDLEKLILVCLLSNLATAGFLWIFVRSRVPASTRGRRRVWSAGLSHVGLGWSVVSANLLATAALSLDRLILSREAPIREFAIYSFAANALALTYNMILSVARVLFPYLSDGIPMEVRIRTYFTGGRILLLLWSGGLAAYFPIAWLVTRWLPQYVQSLPLMRILMLATGFTASIHVLHSNYFRVARKQNRFLYGTVAGLALASVFLAIAMRSGNLENYAWAMAASSLGWWIVNEFLLRDVLLHNGHRIFGTLALTLPSAAAFLLCTALQNRVAGFLLYGAFVAALFGAAGRTILRYVRLPRFQFPFGQSTENVSLD